MPLGVGLTLLGLPVRRCVILVFSLSLAIELTQLRFMAGRNPSATDVVMNTVGGMAGCCLAGVVTSSGRTAARWMVAWGCTWLVFLAVIGYAITPSMPPGEYIGQLAHSLGGRPAFPAHVMGLIGDSSIPDGLLAEATRRRVAEQLGKGMPVRLYAEVHAAPMQLTSLVRVVALNSEEVLSLADDGSRFVFGLRTHASHLRLRPLYFRTMHRSLRRVRAEPCCDSLFLQASVTPARAILSSGSPNRYYPDTVNVSVSAGWRLLAPWPVVVENSLLDRMTDGALLAASVLPLGFLLGRATRRPHVLFWSFLASAAFVSMAIGSVAYSYGLAQPSPWDFGGLAVGLAAGTLAALCLPALPRGSLRASGNA